MYHVFRYNNMPMSVVHNFTSHKGNIKIHIGRIVKDVNDTKHIKWSDGLRKSNPEIISQYHDYVRANINSTPLVLRNKTERQSMGIKEHVLKHNVHGMNKPEYIDSTDASMESALVPSKDLKSFYKLVLLDHIMDNKAKDIAIAHFYSTQLFYQAIMRCKLRHKSYNNEVINIFCLDFDASLNMIGQYFDITNQSQVTDFDIIIKPTNQKKKPLTKKEQNHRAYLKRKLRSELKSQ